MLLLCAVRAPETDVVDPGPQRPVNVQARLGQTLWKDDASLLLGDPSIDRPVVRLVRQVDDRLLPILPGFLQGLVVRLDAVLAIFGVLEARLTKLERVGRRDGVALTKLLERKRAVTKQLASNVARRLNLEADASHLERRPVLVPDQVLDELLVALHELLILRVRDPGRIGHLFDQRLAIGCL